VELDRVNLVGMSMTSMKINDIRGLSGEFSTGNKKMADFGRHLKESLENQNQQRQTEQ